ncbi:MAG: hypothetical protein ABIO76_07465 [Ginsengibacter sp.]
MPFDKLDKKAQEAAKNYSPEYNEEAWNKMEALLNEHMPVQQNPKEVAKKKQPERWLFLLLFLAGCLFLMLVLIPQRNGEKNIKAPGTTEINSKAGIDSNKAAEMNTSRLNSTISNTPNGANSAKNNQLTASATGSVAGTTRQKNSNITGTRRSSVKSTIQNNNADEYNVEKIADREMLATLQQQSSMPQLIHQQIKSFGTDYKRMLAINISITGIPQTNNNLKATKVKPKQQNKNNFKNSFSLSISAGPDVSAINVNNIGTLKMMLGAGIAYKFGKNWQLRTGFYTVKKVYEAHPSDYHPPSNFWNYYPQLDDINANCTVNEIPLIINYSFKQNKKNAWFASTGVSSYFMKRETYTYISKISPGQYQEKSYTIRNQNEHYFSSLRFSAGYERRLNKIISFTTEPYINLPLSGIGYGKVKLNSAGVLFTLNVKPFSNKNDLHSR